MATVRWSAQALAELDLVEAYLASSPAHARAFVRGLLVAADRLGAFPRSGRVVPEMQDEALREVLHRGYRVVYLIDEDVVQVLTVFHSSRSFGTAS